MPRRRVWETGEDAELRWSERPSLGFVLIVLVLTLLLFAAAYSRSFEVLPASDDWPVVVEIQRGMHLGISTFFTHSGIKIGYRPLKSLGIWAFGSLGNTTEQQMAWIRVMHLTFAASYALVAILWIRVMPVGKVGAIVAIALMLLHPVLPQAAASVDGFDTLASSAMLWLGGWCLFYWRDRLWTGVVLALACFAIGVGFKENLFALVPLSVVIVLLFWRRRPWRDAAIVGLSLAVAGGVMIVIRQFAISEGLAPGQQMIRLNPFQIAQNAALFATGLLMFGNSMWVYVNRAPMVITIAAASCLAMLGLIATGIMLRVGSMGDGKSGTGADFSMQKWLVFLLLGLGMASFPTILLYHVSEMYVPPMLLPFALLCGLAADGFRRSGFPLRAVAILAALVALGFSLISIRSKVDGLVDVGLRADRQLKQILAYLPPEAQNQTVAIRFLESDRRPGDLYAVFRMPDSLLLVHKNVLDFVRPYRGLVLDAETVRDFSQVDPSQYDMVLGWDMQKQQFFPLQ